MQYGFITLFSLAFPLAPLLALINNVVEVRLDAIKMLRFVRRPVGMRARNIGVWHNIMTVVTHIAVASSVSPCGYPRFLHINNSLLSLCFARP